MTCVSACVKPLLEPVLPLVFPYGGDSDTFTAPESQTHAEESTEEHGEPEALV